MSLTQLCNNQLSELSAAVLHYSEDEHYAGYTSGLVDAMFSIAKVTSRLNTFDPLYQQYTELAVAKLVFTMLVPDDADENRYPRWHIVMLLVDIACSNNQFARALVVLEEWLLTIEGHHCLANECPELGLVADILDNARWSTAGLAA